MPPLPPLPPRLALFVRLAAGARVAHAWIRALSAACALAAPERALLLLGLAASLCWAQDAADDAISSALSFPLSFPATSALALALCACAVAACVRAGGCPRLESPSALRSAALCALFMLLSTPPSHAGCGGMLRVAALARVHSRRRAFVDRACDAALGACAAAKTQSPAVGAWATVLLLTARPRSVPLERACGAFVAGFALLPALSREAFVALRAPLDPVACVVAWICAAFALSRASPWTAQLPWWGEEKRATGGGTRPASVASAAASLGADAALAWLCWTQSHCRGVADAACASACLLAVHWALWGACRVPCLPLPPFLPRSQRRQRAPREEQQAQQEQEQERYELAWSLVAGATGIVLGVGGGVGVLNAVFS